MARSESATPSVVVGDQFPETELVDEEGNPWSVAELAGHPAVLIFHRHLA